MKNKKYSQREKGLKKQELNLPKSKIGFRIGSVASRLEHRRVGQ